MAVRLAVLEDVAEMSYIHSQTWKKAYVDYISAEYLANISDDGWIPLFTKALKDKIHEAGVFETNRRLTGTITFGKERKNSTPENKEDSWSKLNKEAEIISLYVLPDYWSTKQGYELTRFALERLKSQGFESCFLWVIRDNERATRFYKRYGFESTGQQITVELAGRPLVEEKYRIML